MNNDLLVIGVVLIGVVIAYVDWRIRKKSLASNAVGRCARCGKEISFSSKSIGVAGGGDMTLVTASVCRSCFLKNRIVTVVLCGLMATGFLIAFGLPWLNR